MSRLFCVAVLWFLSVYGLFLTFLSGTAWGADENNTLPTAEAFRAVPDDARPWAYYWWLKGNVTEESITRDLTEMKNLGFGGVLVFDSRGYHEDAERHIPVPLPIRHEFMSPSWRALMIHLIAEADRLGMKVSLNLSNTGGHLRGPWDFAGDGPRTLVSSMKQIVAGETIEIPLTVPSDQRFFKDVALLAVCVESADSKTSLTAGGSSDKTAVDVSAGAATSSEWTPWEPVDSARERTLTVLETVNLTERAEDGKIVWTVPDNNPGDRPNERGGDWLLVRFGSVVIGDLGSVDILNADIIACYFDKMAGTILREADAVSQKMGKKSFVGKTLTHFYNVSWEGGNPNWTDGFERFFAEKRGYALDPFLPVLAGMIVTDRETVDRFMTDFHKTIADAFCENCYRKIGELCHENGIVWHSEDGGPWNRSAPMFVEGDMLSFWGQNDIAQGEFWMNESEKPNPQSNLKFAASASHIYGKRLVAAEAFTHMTHHWTMSPALLKPAADRNFIDGCNMFLWHTFTASPPECGKPGFEYFAGTHINGNVTWQRDAGPFVAYLGRAQTLLRKGDYAADFCVYVSDKNYTAWGRGEKGNPKSEIVIPDGFASDFLNSDVLVHRLEFRDGRYRLPGGMSYRFLIFDPADDELPLAAVEKMVDLVRQGGVVLLGGTKPVRCRGLADGPEGDRRLAKAVTLLWGEEEGTSEGNISSGGNPSNPRTLGTGRIYYGVTPEDVATAEKIFPDFDGPFEYHHRRLPESDVYFLTNPAASLQKTVGRFRTMRRFAELWNPVTGEISDVAVTTTEDGRAEIALELARYGSVFVVLTEKPTESFGKDDAGEIRADRVNTQNAENNETTETAVSTVKERLLDGPWQVAFDPAWGGPSETTFKKLTPWNENSDAGIRYYSGTATYRRTFTVEASEWSTRGSGGASRLRLDLGAVAVIARVRLNGVDCGVAWTDPWEVDLTDAVCVGENRLEIDVTNNWVNRLIGDAGLPTEKRLTKTNVQYYPAGAKHFAYQGYAADEPLRVSGLLGPVRLLLDGGKKTGLAKSGF